MADDTACVAVNPPPDVLYLCLNCGRDIAICKFFVRMTLRKDFYTDFEEVDNVIARRQTKEIKDKFRIIYCELCEKELGGDQLWVPNDKGNKSFNQRVHESFSGHNSEPHSASKMVDDDAPCVAVNPLHNVLYLCRKCGLDMELVKFLYQKTLMKNYVDLKEVDNFKARRQTKEKKDKFRIIYCELCDRELGGDRLRVPNDKGNKSFNQRLHESFSGHNSELHSASKMADDDASASNATMYDFHTDIYLCRNCGTDVCCKEHFVQRTSMKNRADFSKLGNVYTKPPVVEDTYNVKSIYCRVCQSELGIERLWVPQNKAHEGKYFVDLSTLALRKGRDFFDAVTEERLDKNLQYTCCQIMFPEDLKELGEDEYRFDCCKCGNKIAAFNEWIYRDYISSDHYTVFGNLINVTHGTDIILPGFPLSKGQTIRCRTCNGVLGYKVLSVTEDLGELSPGRSLLYTERLRLWKRGKRYNAVTGEPYCITERTFIIFKPDGILVGEIISIFEKKGLKLKGLKFTTVDGELAKKHYAHLSAKKLEGLVEFIVSGPVFAMVWEGINAVFTAMEIIGDTNPTEAAAPGTIRGDYGNVIHGSDSVESAKKEIALWFPEGIMPVIPSRM